MHPFRCAVEARDVAAAIELLSDRVVLRSPVGFAPYRGRPAVAPILRAVFAVFNDFRYLREIGTPDGSEHALVFTARIGDIEVEGCDLLHRDQRGLIDELTVMVRPLTAARALADAMQSRFTEGH